MKNITKIDKLDQYKVEVEKLYGELASRYIEVYRWYYGEGKTMREIAEKLQFRRGFNSWTKSTVARIIKEMDDFLENPYIPKQYYWEMGLRKNIPPIDRPEWWTDMWMDREAVGRTLTLALFVWFNTQQHEIWKIEMEQIYKEYNNQTKRKQLIGDLQKLQVSVSSVSSFPDTYVFKSITERRGKITFEFNEEAVDALLEGMWDEKLLDEIGIPEERKKSAWSFDIEEFGGRKGN